MPRAEKIKDEQFQRRCTRSTIQRERWQKTRRPRSKNAGLSRRMPCSRAQSADWEAECALRRGATAACGLQGHLTQVSRILGFVQRPGVFCTHAKVLCWLQWQGGQGARPPDIPRLSTVQAGMPGCAAVGSVFSPFLLSAF